MPAPTDASRKPTNSIGLGAVFGGWSAIVTRKRGGTDYTVARKIGGHRTRSTFDRYNIVSEDDLRDAMRRTAAYVASLPTERTLVPMAAVAAAGAREHGREGGQRGSYAAGSR